MTQQEIIERLGDRLAAAESAYIAGDLNRLAFAIGGASHWYSELAGRDWEPLGEGVPA